MADIINFGGNKPQQTAPEDQPITEYDYTIYYSEGDPNQSDNVRGFMTVMGSYYFIGRGTPGKIDWLWSAPQDKVFKIIGTPIA